MKYKVKLIISLFLSTLFLLTSCTTYQDEFYYIQGNVTNQEYKIGDEEAFNKISKDANYEFEDYVSYKMFRSKDDLNYYYFTNENRLYRFLTYDTKSSILDYQVGEANKDQFYNNMNDTKKKKNYSENLSITDPAIDDLFLPISNSLITNGAYWCNYFYKNKLIFGILDVDILYGFFIQYK